MRVECLLCCDQQEQCVGIAARRLLDSACFGDAWPQWEPIGERQRRHCGLGQHSHRPGPELHETESASRNLGKLVRTGAIVLKRELDAHLGVVRTNSCHCCYELINAPAIAMMFLLCVCVCACFFFYFYLVLSIR